MIPTFRWYKPTWWYVHTSWRKLSFKPKTWFLKFSDGKWHISEKCLKLGQIIPEQASQWLIFQLNTMPSHYKLTKVRLTVKKRSLLSWEHRWWRKTARKFEEKQAFFRALPFFLYLPEYLDPKCYTWLESYGSEDSHGKKLQVIRVTIWPTEFCQHFEIQIITPADTLSYIGFWPPSITNLSKIGP